MIRAAKEILSFEDAVKTAGISEKSVLVVRHSYRESLINGNHDPGLTAAGWDYAVECGKLLKGLPEVCFGSSSRKRTEETIQGLIRGGEFGEQEIVPYPVLHDTAMFTRPENEDIAIEEGRIPTLLREYFTTGCAPGMRHIQEYVPDLLSVLTADHARRNVVLCTHDIIVVALLSFFGVYQFAPDDWCGYIQGAFLYRQDGSWSISYIVPDRENRKPAALFV